jgi:hypothetical protein
MVSENFKKSNFNRAVKVPQSAIDKLRAGKTKAANVAKYSGTKNAVMREAMNRFYGKGWDKGGAAKPPVKKAAPGKKAAPSTRPSARAAEGSAGYSAPKKKAAPKKPAAKKPAPKKPSTDNRTGGLQMPKFGM